VAAIPEATATGAGAAVGIGVGCDPCPGHAPGRGRGCGDLHQFIGDPVEVARRQAPAGHWSFWWD
jgi:hypothetical protein